MNAKTETEIAVPVVYSAIAAVMGDLAKSGISKDQTNTFDKYKFRGIDDVYNTLAPLLSKHGLLILPRVLERHSEERTSQKGGALFYVTVAVEFDFIAAADGSSHTIRAYGEAMDRGDKGTNKAMTAAYKYACFEAFCIPVIGSDDADSETHEVEAQAPDVQRKAQHDAALARHSESVAFIKERLGEDDGEIAYKEWRAIPPDDQRALWLATSKGGCFTTDERKALKEYKPTTAGETV